MNLAMALVHDPEIVILDEPSQYQDTEGFSKMATLALIELEGVEGSSGDGRA